MPERSLRKAYWSLIGHFANLGPEIRLRRFESASCSQSDLIIAMSGFLPK